MYRQFESSDKPKSAARLLAEAAFAPEVAARRAAADNTAPVVTIINRRLALLRRQYRLASNDALPPPRSASAPMETQVSDPQAAKRARVFLLPAPASESIAASSVGPCEVPVISTALVGADASMQVQEEPIPAQLEFARRGRARRNSQHGPVRVIYSAPQAMPTAVAASLEEAIDTSDHSHPRLESILVLRRAIADVETLLADIQSARSFQFSGRSVLPQLKQLSINLDRLSAQFPKAG